MLLLLLLSFVAGGAVLGPNTRIGGWCKRTVTLLAERLGELTLLRATFLIVGVIAFVGLAYTLPIEMAWLLSTDVAAVLEVMAAAALAASMVRLKRVRLAVGRLPIQAAGLSRAITGGAHERRRRTRPKRPAAPSSDGEPDPAAGWARA